MSSSIQNIHTPKYSYNFGQKSELRRATQETEDSLNWLDDILLGPRKYFIPHCLPVMTLETRQIFIVTFTELITIIDVFIGVQLMRVANRDLRAYKCSANVVSTLGWLFPISHSLAAIQRSTVAPRQFTWSNVGLPDQRRRSQDLTPKWAIILLMVCFCWARPPLSPPIESQVLFLPEMQITFGLLFH